MPPSALPSESLAMVRWVRDNIRPPEAPDIEVTAIGTPSAITRDADGNALGGIRLSQHAVPTATNTGQNTAVIGSPYAVYCRTYGSFVPFTPERLAQLYANHGVYVNEVARVTNENLASGYIVWEDAEATKTQAAESGVGNPSEPRPSLNTSRGSAPGYPSGIQRPSRGKRR